MAENYKLYSDEKLVECAQAGDDYAEETLIKRYKDLVRQRAHLYFIVGADSEDVIQEGMIGLFKAVRDYRNDREAAFRTFATLCINRQIITAIKRAKRLKHTTLNESISLSAPIGGEGVDGGEEINTMENTLIAQKSNPEELILVQDMIDEITKGVPRILSELELEVWELYLDGKNYTEIAAEMGRPPKSIDNAIQRIKRKIAAEYY